MTKKSWNKKKISWVDGDSGYMNGKPFRLAGVKAPEKHQYGGEKAHRSAAGMTGRTNGTANVKPIATDAYGRKVVEMRNRDGSINQRLRDKGYKNKGR